MWWGLLGSKGGANLGDTTGCLRRPSRSGRGHGPGRWDGSKHFAHPRLDLSQPADQRFCGLCSLVLIAILARAVQPGNLRYAVLALLPLVGSFGTDVTRLTVILGMLLFTAAYFSTHKAEETETFIIKYAPLLAPLSVVFYQVAEGGSVSSINWAFWLCQTVGAATDLRPVGPQRPLAREARALYGGPALGKRRPAPCLKTP